jgi:hypothetical protein
VAGATAHVATLAPNTPENHKRQLQPLPMVRFSRISMRLETALERARMLAMAAMAASFTSSVTR